ncbi:hypothetical protein ABW20_dc0100332 [Dactylellina cionopaga]|nr:hypothetical protein ABW20_dc0100332 [Dactylellina cionopaga]
MNISSGVIHAAFTDIKFKYPVVALEHSSHISDVVCPSESIMNISFRTPESYQQTLQWPDEKFVLAGHGYESCHAAFDSDERFWAMVNKIEYDDEHLGVSCSIVLLPLEKVAEEVDISWGAHSVASNPKRGNNPKFDLQTDVDEPQQYRYTVPRRGGFTNDNQLERRAVCNRDILFRSMIASLDLASSFCANFLPKSTTLATTITITSKPPKVTSVSTILKSVGVKVTKTAILTLTKLVSQSGSTTKVETAITVLTSIVTEPATLTTSVSMNQKRAAPADPGWSAIAPSSLTSACACVASMALPVSTNTRILVLQPVTVGTKTTITSTYTVTVQPTKIVSTETKTTIISTRTETYKTVVTSNVKATTTLIVQTVTIPIYPSYSGPAIANFDINDDEQIGDFDQMLDDLLGYMDQESSSFWDNFAPGFMPKTSVIMIKRFDLIGAIVDAFVDNVVKPVAQAFVDLGNAIAAGVKELISLIPPIPITPLYFNFGYDVTPSSLGYNWPKEDTPFGQGDKMYENGGFRVFCIECELKGHFYALGTFSYKLSTNSITKGLVEFSTQFYISLGIALVIENKVEKEWEKTLLEASLGGLVIPSIVSIGPKVELAMGASASASVYGAVMNGFVFDWSPSVRIDFIDFENSYARGNFLPSFDKIFKLQSNIAAEAEVYTLAKIYYGIDLFKGALKLGASFNDQPGIEAELTFEAHSDGSATGNGVNDDECLNGVGVGINFKNEIFMGIEILGFTVKIPFYTFEKSLVDFCWTFEGPAGSGGSTPATGTTATSTSLTTTTTLAATTTKPPYSQSSLESVSMWQAYCPDYHGRLVLPGGKLSSRSNAGGSIHALVLCGWQPPKKIVSLTTPGSTIATCWSACGVASSYSTSKCGNGAIFIPASNTCELLIGENYVANGNWSFLGGTDLQGYDVQSILWTSRITWVPGLQYENPWSEGRNVYEYPNNTNIGFVTMQNIVFVGSDITSLHSINMGRCMDACIEWTGEKQCVAVTFSFSRSDVPYTGYDGNCTLKYSFSSDGMKVTFNNGTLASNPYSFWSAYSGAVGLKPLNPTICPGLDRQYVPTKNLKTYFIRCDTAIWEYPTWQIYAANFNDCIEMCSTQNGCIAATFWPGEPKPCYMKNGFAAASLQVRKWPGVLTAMSTTYVVR